MYTLEQLKTLELAELQKIATEMGISNVDKYSKDDLGYTILDQQADTAAAKENGKATKKRTRVSVKNVDRVYTANQEKAKKVDKKMQVAIDDTLFGALSQEEKSMLTPPTNNAISETTAAAEEAAPKKRGRKKKEEAQAETPAPKKTKKKAEQTEEPKPVETKKRGRKKKSEAEEVQAESVETVETSAIMSPAPSTSEEATGVPEAEENISTHFNQVITLGSTTPATFTPPTDGTDFIIVKDVEPYASVLQRLNADMQQPMPKKNEKTQMAFDDEPQVQNKTKNAPVVPEPIIEKEPQFNFDDIVEVTGVLETQDNFGFIRSSDYNYLPSPDDVYVTLPQIKHWGLKNGDVVQGHIRPPRDNERWFMLTDVTKVNGCDPAKVRDRISFEFLTPLFPDQKYQLCKGYDDSKSSRIVDLFSPIGKGQRALIVAQPKTGKTLLMKDIANSISRNHPEAYLMMLLIDERPEEVTDMARTVNAEVIASTFDAPAENHVKIAGIVLEKAKRMVECGHDVVIFLDSITRLARAYNTVSPASGKVLSGGVDANALQKPKRFFGAARNIEGGGSLTIIATALIDTGSKMDEVIFEEFKGTGNMELQLDRQLANKRIFPAVNLLNSSTRRDDLLQDQTTLNRMWILRKHIADMTTIEAMDTVMNYIDKTKTNEEFLLSMNG